MNVSSSLQSSPFISPQPSPMTSPSHKKSLEELDATEVSHMVLGIFKRYIIYSIYSMYSNANIIITTINITNSWQCLSDPEHRTLYISFSEEFMKRNVVGADLASADLADLDSILSLLHLNQKDIATIKVRIQRLFKEVINFIYHHDATVTNYTTLR